MTKLHGQPENANALSDAKGVPLAAIQAEAARQGFHVSRLYTDRSNCRKAMKAHAAKHKLKLDDFAVKMAPAGKGFVFEGPASAEEKATAGAANEILGALVTEAVQGDGLDIPAMLQRPPEAAGARRERIARLAGSRADHPGKRIVMPKPEAVKAAKTAERAAKVAVKGARTKDAGKGRYPWTEHEEAAKAGKMPPKLDFTAETHKRFRPTLAELEKLAKAGDVKGLRAVKINAISTSPKAMDRWRKMCIAALTAKAKAAA